jgi:hypothetical protein
MDDGCQRQRQGKTLTRNDINNTPCPRSHSNMGSQVCVCRTSKVTPHCLIDLPHHTNHLKTSSLNPAPTSTAMSNCSWGGSWVLTANQTDNREQWTREPNMQQTTSEGRRMMNNGQRMTNYRWWTIDEGQLPHLLQMQDSGVVFFRKLVETPHTFCGGIICFSFIYYL